MFSVGHRTVYDTKPRHPSLQFVNRMVELRFMGIGGKLHLLPSTVQGLDMMGSSLPSRHCAQGNLQNATSAASLALYVPSLFRSRCTQDTLRLSKVLGARQAVTRTSQTRLDRGAMWQRPRRAAPPTQGGAPASPGPRRQRSAQRRPDVPPAIPPSAAQTPACPPPPR